MQKGIELCQEVKPDLLLATDPDADRVGVACADGDDYTLITGNEMGVLLLDYICKMRLERGEDLSHKVAVTTIVSSAMVDALAQEYGFEMRRALPASSTLATSLRVFLTQVKSTALSLVLRRATAISRATMCATRTLSTPRCSSARWLSTTSFRV